VTSPTPVKDETQRQVVILVFSTIGTLVTIYLIYEFAKPDAFKTLKMRLALWAKRFSQGQVDWWQQRADDAATLYNKERP
jgi:hypothetical protein